MQTSPRAARRLAARCSPRHRSTRGHAAGARRLALAAAAWPTTRPPREADAENPERKPDPDQLVREDGKTPRRNERPDTQRRHLDGPEREEVARPVEWAQQRHAETSVRERIEHAVRGHREKQVEPGPWPGGGRDEPRDERRYDRREGNRVQQAAVTEKMLVGEAERERQHVEVGSGGTEHSRDPEPPRHAPPGEGWDECEGRSCVRESGRHL